MRDIGLPNRVLLQESPSIAGKARRREQEHEGGEGLTRKARSGLASPSIQPPRQGSVAWRKAPLSLCLTRQPRTSTTLGEWRKAPPVRRTKAGGKPVEDEEEGPPLLAAGREGAEHLRGGPSLTE